MFGTCVSFNRYTTRVSFNRYANPVIALQRINPMGELGCFHHLKQRTNEQKLAQKRTVELCHGNTDIVVIRQKKDKSVSDMTEIEIDSLD